MARRSFALAPLKLTRRPAGGSVMKKDMHQGAKIVEPINPCLSGHSGDPPTPVSPSPMPALPWAPVSVDTVEETMYSIEEKSSVAGWEAIREKLRFTVTECVGMPVGQACVLCRENSAIFRCLQCGPQSYYCQACTAKLHSESSFLHTTEQWMGDHYVPVVKPRYIDVSPTHMCSTKKTVSLTCVDEFGSQHSINFASCGCEPLPVTLARAKLWPATPHHPRMVFTFGLLDWAEALMLEAQVSLHDFCRSLTFKGGLKLSKKMDIYKSLINSFEEYRHLKHELRHLHYLSKELDSGNVCPACPKAGGKVVYACDALFGLPRKKSAGHSHREPLHGNLWFGDQKEVDEFVAQSRQSRKIKNECSNFVAGDALRSNSRYRALDETAIFGCACRHEFPVKFINLKHGERLAYAVWMLEEVIKANESTGNELFFMYDIACTLHSHLSLSQRSDVLDEVTLCLPIFHSFGHKASCQVLFGPRRCSGIGLSDGETMERLWSYLRRFSHMTKEMRPSHRVDVLAHALVYYGILTQRKLANMLLSRWERACSMAQVAEEALAKLYPQGITDGYSAVEKWISEEVDSYKCSASVTKPDQWKILYYHSLRSYFIVRSNVLADERQSISSQEQLASMEKKLEEIERKHSISSRWTQSDKQYQELESRLVAEKKEQLLRAIWTAAKRRAFLLKLKAKYADGQKIAKRLSRQIARETKNIKDLLLEHNLCCSSTDGLPYSSALDLEILSNLLAVAHSSPEIKKKREVIEEYLLYLRSQEEIKLIEAEVETVLTFYSSKKAIIEAEMQQYSDSSAYSIGAKCLLTQLFEDVAQLHQSMENTKMVMKKPRVNEEYIIGSTSSESDNDF